MNLSKKYWLGALLIIIVVCVAAYVHTRALPAGPAACAPSALLCPDGSTIYPEGDACVYAACANTGPLTGELRQVSGGFQLMLAAPTTTTQEVTYALPLKTKDSSALLPFVGKNVTVYGTFTEGATFVVDHFALAGNPDPTVGQVRVGQTAFINGVRITLSGVTNDSRCPKGVACIRAGRVTAHVALKSDTDFASTTLMSDAAPFGFDAFLISITSVEPPRSQTSAPAQSDYVLTFKVANTSTTNTFDEVGNVIRNNPGLTPNVWYLTYEKPGAPALTVELDLNAVAAPYIDLTQGERVHVVGSRSGSVVVVSAISPE